VLLVFLILVGCKIQAGEGQEARAMNSLDQIGRDDWQGMSSTVVFFGHQSVGSDILAGMEFLLEKSGQQDFRIATMSQFEQDGQSATLVHARIGRNTRPETKMEEFSAIMDRHGHDVNAALFKFCYVDIGQETDIDSLFSQYMALMEDLASRYPKLKLLHCTVPLTSRQTGVKAWIKKLMQRPVRGYADNMARHEINERLRKAFDQDTVFDLAHWESTYPDGSRSYFTRNNTRYYSLIREYTSDGGHLNEQGREFVAERFLLFLARALQ